MNEEALFHLARQKPSHERAAFLAEACREEDVRRRVEALLEADGGGPATTVDPRRGRRPGPAAAEPHPAPERPGGRVGPYKLLQQIGEGGMGTVWMAQQLEPVKRKVALKLIKPGMDSREIIARVEAERQALALMDHPGIARFLDAGSTEQGRPYFVMELVQGVPITRFCDERKLSPRERLGLFVQVCAAVQHAHQKGVIHRDLKPSNVLVALRDDRAEPKVIDFGVAKATGQRLTEKTLFTEFGAVVGTLEYMSPEQAQLNQLDIDTRSDVYSLGVMLYELLTGTTPLERERVKEPSLLELLRVIREEEPPRPSARLSTTAELPGIAANRSLEPKALRGLVRGELDWVVMKCLEKDRSRRYETANALARDLQRYLADEAVEAGRPSLWHRGMRFARRHRGPVLTAGLVFLAVLAGLGVSLGQAYRASRAEGEARQAAEDERAARQGEAEQRRQAEAVAGLLQSAFVGLDPVNSAEDLLSHLVDRLDTIIADLATNYTGDPLVRARLDVTLGRTLSGLGEYRKALAVQRRARDTREAHLGPEHPDSLTSNYAVAVALLDLKEPANARPLLERVLAAQTALLGADDPSTLDTMSSLGSTLVYGGEVEKGMAVLQDALRGQEARLGADHPHTLHTRGLLATAYCHRHEIDSATRELERVVAGLRPSLGAHHPRTLTATNQLAFIYQMTGQLDKALSLHETALKAQTAKLGPDHKQTVDSVKSISMVYNRQGKLEKTEELQRDVLARTRRRAGPASPESARELNELAVVQLRRKDYTAAEVTAREALPVWGGLGSDPWGKYSAQLLLGEALAGQKKYAEAEPLLLSSHEGLTRRRDTIAGPAQRTLPARSAGALAKLYEAWGQPDKAADWRKRQRESAKPPAK